MPDWVTVLAESASSARLIARPPLRSGSVTKAYDLTVRHGEKGLEVAETTIGTRLPEQCPELHIMAEGTFCMSRQVDRILTAEDAQIFWRRLGDFLVDQHFAERKRIWPAGRWMSHGNIAANEQEAAEAIAERNGWAEDYANAIENDEGWIAKAVRGGVGPPGVANCPCSVDLPGSPRQRCKHRRDVERIVAGERRRRMAERRYLDGLYDGGLRCCGRINGCKLEARSDVV